MYFLVHSTNAHHDCHDALINLKKVEAIQLQKNNIDGNDVYTLIFSFNDGAMKEVHDSLEVARSRLMEALIESGETLERARLVLLEIKPAIRENKKDKMKEMLAKLMSE